MHTPTGEGAWYAVHTKPKQENRALENLQNQGFECFLPLLEIEKVRRGKVQTVMKRGRGKANHLRELARGDERTVRLGDHKNTIEGKSAHVGKRVRDADAAHGFHRMNKKPG